MKPTPLPWKINQVEDRDGSCSYYYFVLTDANGNTIVDTYNSNLVVFEEDEKRRWDEQGRANIEFLSCILDSHKKLLDAGIKVRAHLLADTKAGDVAMDQLRESVKEAEELYQ